METTVKQRNFDAFSLNRGRSKFGQSESRLASSCSTILLENKKPVANQKTDIANRLLNFTLAEVPRDANQN